MDFIQQCEFEDSVIDLSQSEAMDAIQQVNFLRVRVSHSSNFSADPIAHFLNAASQVDHPLIWQSLCGLDNEHPQVQESTVVPTNGQQPNGVAKTPKRKKKVKEGSKNKSDYEKNICGYITRRVVREFIGNSYDKEIRKLMTKYGGDFDQCKTYYTKRMEFITGPSHLPPLFENFPGDASSLASCKKAFREFYTWFLRHRYLRYLLNEGKMTNKQAYIQYKNTHLFKFAQKPEDQANKCLQRLETRFCSSQEQGQKQAN